MPPFFLFQIYGTSLVNIIQSGDIYYTHTRKQAIPEQASIRHRWVSTMVLDSSSQKKTSSESEASRYESNWNRTSN